MWAAAMRRSDCSRLAALILAMACAAPLPTRADDAPGTANCYEIALVGYIRDEKNIVVLSGSWSARSDALVKVDTIFAGENVPKTLWSHVIMHATPLPDVPILFFLKRRDGDPPYRAVWFDAPAATDGSHRFVFKDDGNFPRRCDGRPEP